MSGLKTKETQANVEEFLDAVKDEQKKKDSFKLLHLMQEVTGKPAKMWGDSIVGFGNYHYKYDSGREGDWFLTGFSPRKQNLSVYIVAGFSNYQDLMKDLGKYKTASSCLYIKKLEDINTEVLKELIKRSVKDTEERYR
jgi:hypothetical protein